MIESIMSQRFLPRWMKKSKKGTGNDKAVEDKDDTVATAELEIVDFSEAADSASFPTIHLGIDSGISPSGLSTAETGVVSPLSDNVAAGRFDPEADIETPAPVVATPINDLDWTDPALDDSFGSTCPSDESDERAAYVSAAAFNCDGKGIGLQVRSFKGRLRISAISSNSVFASGPLRVGDDLVSINAKSCDPILDGGQATRILNHLKGTVAVVVSTKGDPGIIECMIAKTRVDCDTGLGLKYLERRLQILSLDKAGLWTHSLLNEGNHVLSINGTPCSQLDGETAETLINSCESNVTIVAKAIQECAVVIEEKPTSPQQRPFNARKRRSCAYYSPCFQRVTSPAQIAQIGANVTVLALSVVACWLAEVGLFPSLVAVGLCLLAINVPWIGWKERGGNWCSVGQVFSTLLVLIMCAVVMPMYFGADLTTTLGRNLGIAIPMTVIVNLPMHFSDDNIEQYTIESELLASGESGASSESSYRPTQSGDAEIGTNQDDVMAMPQLATSTAP